jgi:nitrate/nitrite-specific signal transduction histidine kinase
MSVKQSYVLIFALLIFWASFAFYTMHSLIASQSYYAELINKSGKQRMLSQKIVLHAYLHRDTGESVELQNVQSLLLRFQSDFEYIAKNLTTPESKELYLSNQGIVQKVNIFVNAAEQYVKTQNDVTLQSLQEHALTLLPLLDSAVTQFQIESEAKTRELQSRELFIYLATVLTILFEAHFFARPVIEKIKMKFSVFRRKLDK